jgi:RHS repeat-associated protein
MPSDDCALHQGRDREPAPGARLSPPPAVGSNRGKKVRSAVRWAFGTATDTPTGGCLGGRHPHNFPIDPNGNLASKAEGTDNWGYEWNARNELTRVTKNGAEQARFAYDPLGRRVEKVAAGVTTTYTYEGEDILREVRGGITLKYVHGDRTDEPLAKEDGSGALTYYHVDGLGSVVKLTNVTGAVTLTRQYDGWGNLESGANEPGFAFTGREWDPETGLYYYRARYYSAIAGRFLSEDPIGYYGGLNLYGYVDGNPANLRDPRGLWPRGTDWIPLGPPCGLIEGIRSFSRMNAGGTRYAHCWASCEITKSCGSSRAKDWETIKERYDVVVCKAGLEKNCDSAEQPTDYSDNDFGRKCPQKQSCEERCKSLFGAPDGPPGPYGRGGHGLSGGSH